MTNYNHPPFILASSSLRRRELLEILGLEFEVIPSHIEEEGLSGETPQEHVVRLSRAKAIKVGRAFPNRWILGADTIVFIDGKILGKPRTGEDACSMLKKLSGREHTVKHNCINIYNIY